MMKQIILMFLLLQVTLNAIAEDIVDPIPGYDKSFNTKIYAGFLATQSQDRLLHYVFVQSINGDNNADPLTLWLNGGPGCSSLLGFLQQIGPYYLEDGKQYNNGDQLTENPNSWHKIANLLFLQSPAGVGYSVNKNKTYEYNDISTAKDNLQALLNFFKSYPEYSKASFWIAGQSYAGKYIPDLAVSINTHNIKNPINSINLKGMLIGNGVMSFQDNELEKSSIDYMINHDFIDEQLIKYYERSCKTDSQSAGCNYFKDKFQSNVQDINPYSITYNCNVDIYNYCYYDTNNTAILQSQTSILKQFIRKGEYSKDFNGAPCAFFKGVNSYFNLHVDAFHGDKSWKWQGPCNEDVSSRYTISPQGSMNQYRQLLTLISKYQIVLYNGDWDDVVPYTDTIKNLLKLNLKASNTYSPFYVNGQHAGFNHFYSGIALTIIKGASHQVPQSKRAEAFYLFQSVISSGNQPKYSLQQ